MPRHWLGQEAEARDSLALLRQIEPKDNEAKRQQYHGYLREAEGVLQVLPGREK
jgi:hypothetical protein